MYVDTWIIGVAIVIFLYLVFRLEKRAVLIKDLLAVSDSIDKSQLHLNRQLIDAILYEDSRVFSKMSQKQRDKILLDQANDIRIAFASSYKGTYYVNGQIVNDRPIEFYLSSALGSPVEYIEKDPSTTNFSIVEAMRARIEELTRK